MLGQYTCSAFEKKSENHLIVTHNILLRGECPQCDVCSGMSTISRATILLIKSVPERNWKIVLCSSISVIILSMCCQATVFLWTLDYSHHMFCFHGNTTKHKVIYGCHFSIWHIPVLWMDVRWVAIRLWILCNSILNCSLPWWTCTPVYWVSLNFESYYEWFSYGMLLHNFLI